ncbi:DNA ligase (ATP), partial [Rhizophlyctis rosea]
EEKEEDGLEGEGEGKGVRGFRRKRDVEVAVVEHGGKVVQNPERGTRMIIADAHTLKVSNLKKAGKYDIVQSRYIADCIAANTLKPLNARYMIHTTDETREGFKKNADIWGDEYVEDLTAASLYELFNTMDTSRPTKRRRLDHLPPSYSTLSIDPRLATIREIEDHYFSMTPHEGSLFRNCVFYLDRYRSIRVRPEVLEPDFQTGSDVTIVTNSSDLVPEYDKLEHSWLDVVGLEIRSRGGTVVDVLGAGVTHVVVDGRCREKE